MKAGCVIKTKIKHVFLKALKHNVENLGVCIVENMYIGCSNKQIVKLSICGSFNCSAWAFSTDLMSQIKVLYQCQYSTMYKIQNRAAEHINRIASVASARISVTRSTQ